MSGARRLLLAGGIALAVWGMGYGLWYAVFAEHQALEEIGSSLAAGFCGASARDSALTPDALPQHPQAKIVYHPAVGVPRPSVRPSIVLLSRSGPRLFSPSAHCSVLFYSR